jgi:hypothetical protein
MATRPICPRLNLCHRHQATSNEFCEELKSLYPPQCVALLTGWYTFVPQDSCPDDVIPRGEGPATFITRVAELVAKP